MAILKKAKGAWTAIGLLCLTGAVAVGVRLAARQRGGLPNGDSAWNLVCHVQFVAEKEGAYARVAVPQDSKSIRVYGQDFTSPGMRQEQLRVRADGTREMTAIALRTGVAEFDADFDLHLSPTADWRAKKTPQTLSADQRVRLLQPGKAIQSESDEVTAALRILRSRKPAGQATMVSLIFDYCTQEIAFDPDDNSEEDAASTLRERSGGRLGRANAMVAMCRGARIPARLVVGLRLQEQPEQPVSPHIWLEAFIKERWQPYDTEYGHAMELPANYLVFRRGSDQIVSIADGTDAVVTFTLTRRPLPRGLMGNGRENPVAILDMTRLPIVTQTSLMKLLMLPFGAFLTTLFRNFVGIKTFGTFSPTMLALAALYADWRTVLVIFLLVIVFGVGGRALLPGFKLMQAPRLSIVFTLVAISMVLSVSLLDYFGWNPTGQIALLPMVVLTSLVDRIYTTADNDGTRVAMVRLGWTTVVACCCFALFHWKACGLVMLKFPEVHLMTIAAMLLIGLYAGPKLADWNYFAFLNEPESEKKSEGDGGEAKTSEQPPEVKPTESAQAPEPGNSAKSAASLD